MNEFAETYYQKASHLSEIGRWQEAIKEAGLCLAIEPSHYRALCTISRAYYQLEESQKALEFAEKAIQADPTQEWAYRLQSAVYSQTNKKKKQLESALEAIKQEPESTLALQNLAYAQMERKKFKEARQTAEKLRQLSPDSVESHKTFGYLEFNNNDFVKAEEHFRSALKIQSDDYNSLNMLGETLMKRYGKSSSFKTKKLLLNDAINCFRQAIAVNPTLPEAKKNLRDTHFKTLASTPLFLLPFIYNLFLLFLFLANRNASGKALRPEIFNLDHKPAEVAALYWICGLCSLLALYGVAAIYGMKGLSESNVQILSLAGKPTFWGRMAFAFWLLVSTYPLILLIWKIVTLDLATFMNFNVFDWIMLLLGFFALIFNALVILPYILGENAMAYFKNPKPQQ